MDCPLKNAALYTAVPISEIFTVGKRRKVVVVFAVITSFLLFVLAILYLGMVGTITPEMSALMLVALSGLYVGFGVLIAVYRLIDKLQ
jgi:hypothetical protein